MAWTDTPYDTLINDVKKKGDSNAYYELLVQFRDGYPTQVDSLIKYSKIMSLKYNDKKAYFDYLDALLFKDAIETDYYQHYGKLDIKKMHKQRKEEVIYLLNEMVRNKVLTQAQFDSIKK